VVSNKVWRFCQTLVAFLEYMKFTNSFIAEVSSSIYENMESSENHLLFIPTFFEIVQSVEFVDPYDSIWLKLITIGVYLVQILSALVNMAFVSFETRGLAGHYRTLINQLLSYLYGAVNL
jgi:hypothetical protein